VTGTAPRPAPTRLLTPAFVALFAAVLAFFTAGGIVLPVAARFVDGPLGADAIGVGVGIGAFSIAALLLRPVVGWSSDRFGRRPNLLVGGGLTIVALVAHLAVDSLPTFVLVRAGLGVGEAFFFVAGLAAISDLAPPDRQGEAINVGSLALYLGLAIGPFVGEAALGTLDYGGVWLLAAAVAAVATALCLLVPESAPSVLAVSDGGTRTRGRLFHPAGILPGLLILCGTWGMAGFFAFAPLHATAVGLDGAGIALAMYALIVVGLRIVFAKLPDRVGAPRLSGVALVITAVGLAIIGLVPTGAGLIVGTAIFATGVAFVFPALIAVAIARVDETERGSVVGTSSAFLDLSFGLAPATLGIVADASGYPAAFLVGAAVALVGAVVIAVMRRSMALPPRTLAA
jgi:MFS family permease